MREHLVRVDQKRSQKIRLEIKSNKLTLASNRSSLKLLIDFVDLFRKAIRGNHRKLNKIKI